MRTTRKFCLIALTIAAIVLLSSCASTPKHKPGVGAPGDEWVDDNSLPTLPVDPNFIFGQGVGESQEMQMAVTRARSKANQQIAMSLGNRFRGMVRDYTSQTGTGTSAELEQASTNVIQEVQSETLIGVIEHSKKVQSNKSTGLYRCILTLKLPIGQGANLLYNKISANQVLKTKFDHKKVEEEMMKATDKLDEEKGK